MEIIKKEEYNRNRIKKMEKRVQTRLLVRIKTSETQLSKTIALEIELSMIKVLDVNKFILKFVASIYIEETRG